MAEITLKATTGRTTGTRPSRRLRAEGKVPAVVYGQGTDPTAVLVDWHDLRAVLTTDAGLNALIDLDVDGTSFLTIVKDMQRHPIRHSVTHVDFLVINRDEEITVEVPITLVGEADEVTKANGIVDHQLFTLSVISKPGAIPNEIEVDISELQLGDAIRVSDLSLPAGARTEIDPEEVIVQTQSTRAAEEAPAADGEGEGGAEGEGAAEGGEGAEG